MAIDTRYGITPSPEAQFFLSPETPLHRQYEALRCFFVEQTPSKEVARRFGYSYGAFRVLCHEFRHDPAKRAAFFQEIKRGPQNAPARDRVRHLAVAMRKKNLSVYDIQRELADGGYEISINALSVLMREEGFARLPRRRDDERPATLKPEAAAVADVQQVNLSSRSFRTRVGGLFLFVPLMKDISLGNVLRKVDLPGSEMIPAEQAVRSLLALKLIGKERKSHVMDLVFDEGIALFAGLNVVPKRSYLAAYSSRVDHDAALGSILTSILSRPTPRKNLWKSTMFQAGAEARKAYWSSWPAMPRSVSSAMPTPESPRPSGPVRSYASLTSGRNTPGSFPLNWSLIRSSRPTSI